MSQVQRRGNLEIGEDLDFQHKEWRIQRIGWVVMALVIIAALLGLLGSSGPLSSVTAAEGDLSIEYSRFLHMQQPTTLRFHLGEAAVSGDEARLWVDLDYLNTFQVEHITPQPESVEAASDRLVYIFHVTEPGQDITVTLYISPEAFGSITGQAGYDDGRALTIAQLVFP